MTRGARTACALAILCGPERLWFSRAVMKHAPRMLFACLFLIACKPMPPKTAGAAAPGGGAAPGTGPAPAPLVGHNLVYNGDFAKGTRALPWNGELSKPAAGKILVDKGEVCLEVTN